MVFSFVSFESLNNGGITLNPHHRRVHTQTDTQAKAPGACKCLSCPSFRKAVWNGSPSGPLRTGGRQHVDSGLECSGFKSRLCSSVATGCGASRVHPQDLSPPSAQGAVVRMHETAFQQRGTLRR